MTMPFPETGASLEDVIANVHALTRDDFVSDGRKWAMNYDAGPKVKAAAEAAFVHFMGRNGLDPTLYPSLATLERDVVDFCRQHLRGDEAVVGTFTSCGTESCMLSVKTARDHARKTRPHITRPELLLPETAHASFHKAAHYFGLEAVTVTVDPVSMRCDVEDLKAKLSENTVLIVGSAPSYAHGVIDPIEAMASVAREAGVLMHVDACIGGWVLPFMRDNGVELPDFDFTVEGVTSMSVDLHKYAFAPKGVSVLLQRNAELRDAQYYACARWSGYSIVNSTMLGSKSCASLAAAWAVIQLLGREGYREIFAEMWEATRLVANTVQETDGVELVGQPDMPLMAFTTTDHDVFLLADLLTKRGWFTQATFGFGSSPALIHLTIDPAAAKNAEAFAADIRAAAAELAELPKPDPVAPELVAMLEGMMTSESGDGFGALMGSFGIEGGKLPEQSAMINRIMNALPPHLREALMSRFIGALFS